MIDYAKFVAGLIKSGTKILLTLTPAKINMWHMATGISGEAGELLDAIKKHVVYGKDLDIENVKEELGDLEFYMEGLRQELGLSRDAIIEGNTDKLSVRYKDGYSDKAAQDRADKVNSTEII